MTNKSSKTPSGPELFQAHEPARDERGALRLDREFTAPEAEQLDRERRQEFERQQVARFKRRSGAR